jgi:hypothetical protein
LRIERDGDETEHLFAGEGAALGALTNCYGTVALIRRGVLTGGTGRWPVEGDPDWPLLARLSSAGARIVSVPLPLVTRRASPGSLDRHPSDALLVAHELEGALPRSAASALRLAAGLAAEIGRRPTGTPRAALLSPARRAARRLLGR